MSAPARIDEQKTLPDYTYWRNALAGTFGPVHDSDPQLGFYRKRTHKSGPYVPVAIWEQGGKVVALCNGREADAAELWTYVCKYPIAEEWYHARIGGAPWPDEDPAVSASLAPPPVGHNQADKVDSLKDQIASALSGVSAYANVEDDEAAAKAQSLRSRLLELHRDADKERDVLKRPHLEAERAVDAEWMPLVKSAKAGADTIKKALDAHETAKFKAEQTVLAAQRIKDAEEAAKHAPIGAAPEPTPDPIPAPVAAPIRGAYGRAAGVKIVKIAKVTDQDAAYLALKSQPELAALIQKLAQKMVDAGFSLAGVEITEERKVS